MIYFCPVHNKFFKSSMNNNYRSILRQEQNLTIIDKWNEVPVPPAPTLTSVKIDPKTTALLILDMENTICKSSNCKTTVNNIQNLLNTARKNNMLIIYSLTPGGNPSEIFEPLAPQSDELIVQSNVDKFYNTNLSQTLREKGIKTVIVTGYSANGAVLDTATSAAFRGYNIIVPVDSISADNPYAEQYTAWHMLNSPGTRNKSVLSKVDLISIQ
ncbi:MULTISPECIES: cysteine hydrolase [Clostridium]|uniref:cysteine hydrolase n=1 Tax=Clostridium TaxID=1485 RepID=UPI000824C0DF|nr:MULTISPECIES: cysteine hydrolase [Clostridium]PJI06918.1 cysteine hydrolase [Clostridium sp. CT7]